MWAQQLALSFASGRFGFETLMNRLPRLQDRWSRKARSRLRGRSVPWYAEAKLNEGAASTLLGLELRADAGDGGACVWQALAVGDSCLVQVRQGTVIEKFPVERSADFTNHPMLIFTRAERLGGLDVKTVSGMATTGDSFYLMTDAAAKWFLAQEEHGEKPWEILNGFDAFPEGQLFVEWVEEMRQTAVMDDDDVTVLRVDLSG
jgi:hypothetical protein